MTTLVDAPARVDGVQLLGEMVGSGYRNPPSLVRRSDGQTLQLTPLLYAVLDAVDGHRTPGRDRTRGQPCPAARRLGGDRRSADGPAPQALGPDQAGRRVRAAAEEVQPAARTQAQVRRHRPAERPGGSPTRSGSCSGRCRWHWSSSASWRSPAGCSSGRASGRRRTTPSSDRTCCCWSSCVTVLSGGFHEFGHAAAARYSGADPGTMGAGLYLVWPAFYTDVTDSYRLARAGRIRTDLGGLYFNAIVVVSRPSAWCGTRWDALLLLVRPRSCRWSSQLMPMVRFDGYHVLADLAGVPDLYHRIKPTLLGLLPHRWSDPRTGRSSRGPARSITAWVLVTVPMMAFMLLAMVTSLPRLLGTAGAAVSRTAGRWRRPWSAALALDVVAQRRSRCWRSCCRCWRGASSSDGSRAVPRGLAPWSRGSVRRRAMAVALAALVVTGLAWAWGPRPGNYRPISPEKGPAHRRAPGRGGTAPGPPGRRARRPRRTGRRRRTPAVRRGSAGGHLPAGQALPTKAHPQLAMVLVPSSDRPGATGARRTSRGCSPSTSRCPRPRATTRRRRTTPPTARRSTTSPSPSSGRPGRGAQRQRGARLRSCSNCVTVAVASRSC